MGKQQYVNQPGGAIPPLPPKDTMTATNPNDNRLQVRLSPEYQKMVAWLRAEMNRNSDSDTVRQCIYETYVRMKQENPMQITKNQNRIVVSGYGKQYAVDENENARLANGNEAEMTVGEAHAAGLLRVVDDPEGKTHGMHGALYVQ